MSYAPPYGDPYGRPPADPYGRPPSDAPPYQQPYAPYGAPPADPYARPPSERPPYERGPYSAPPPGARPPQNPPPPLPAGWHQEWEPSTRRAFWVEDATGRSQWETPYAQPAYSGYNDGSRSVPPPEPQGGYYAPPPGPPPVNYDNRPPGGGYYDQQQEPEKKKSNAGKYLAMGAAGLAVGGLAGAYLEHEHDEDEERSDVEDAYEAGRRDEAYEDDYGSD